jgi:hypothetical protein
MTRRKAKWKSLTEDQNGYYLELGDGIVRFEILQRDAEGWYRGFVHVADERWISEGIMEEDVAKQWCEAKFRNILQKWKHKIDDVTIERLGLPGRKGAVYANKS